MRILAIVVGLVAWGAPRAGRCEFKFKTPAGWLDLSANAPAANFAKAPPQVAATARAQKLPFFAADVQHANDGFMENANVVLVDGTIVINEQTIRTWAENMDAEVKKQSAIASLKLLETTIVQIGGVHCARLVALLTIGQGTVQQVTYVIPGHRQHAVLTYSTVPAQFKQYEPIFDAAARETKGAESPR
jgi:hypothetical protein